MTALTVEIAHPGRDPVPAPGGISTPRDAVRLCRPTGTGPGAPMRPGPDTG